MAGLKELRSRLESIKSTQKITSAMKLVAASRLRKAQLMLDKSSAYSQTLNTAVKRIMADIRLEEKEKKITFLLPPLLREKPNAKNYLLLVFASDRGLAGNYNQTVGKAAIKRINELQNAGCNVKLICYGKKAFDLLKKKYAELIIGRYAATGSKGLSFAEAGELTQNIKTWCAEQNCEICEIIYSHFHSALSRDLIHRQIYPMVLDQLDEADLTLNKSGNAYYDFGPERMTLLEAILPKLMADRVFDALLNAEASEQGARMAAMDNATRNAQDMISSLTLRYNSIRQSAITTELTEIISGAEAI